MTTTLAHTSARVARPGAPATGGYLFWCTGCGKASTPSPVRARIRRLADAHERRHHAGAGTTRIAHTDHSIPLVPTGGSADTATPFTCTLRVTCESCTRNPATLAWHHPAAGSPFLLCQDCAAITAPTATTRPRCGVRS
jgi:hypothetical protein